MNIATFGASNEYTEVYPDQRIYAFNPNYIEVTGTAVSQAITLTTSTMTLKRYTDANNKVKFPIQAILQSFFIGAEFGDVLPPEYEEYTNEASKCTVSGDIIIQVGTDSGHTKTLTFDIIWGGINRGEVEKTVDTIYRFGDYPLTITQTAGDSFRVSPILDGDTLSGLLPLTLAYHLNVSGYGFGKEIYLSELPLTDSFIVEILESDSVIKTYKVIDLIEPDGIYLRWIDSKGCYRYFMFNTGKTSRQTKDGSYFNNYIDNIEPSDEGLIKGDTQLKNIVSNPIDICGCVGNIDVQNHLIDLPDAIKVWKYVGTSWIEVQKVMKPIEIDKQEQNKIIELTVISPKLFTQQM